MKKEERGGALHLNYISLGGKKKTTETTFGLPSVRTGKASGAGLFKNGNEEREEGKVGSCGLMKKEPCLRIQKKGSEHV